MWEKYDLKKRRRAGEKIDDSQKLAKQQQKKGQEMSNFEGYAMNRADLYVPTSEDDPTIKKTRNPLWTAKKENEGELELHYKPKHNVERDEADVLSNADYQAKKDEWVPVKMEWNEGQSAVNDLISSIHTVERDDDVVVDRQQTTPATLDTSNSGASSESTSTPTTTSGAPTPAPASTSGESEEGGHRRGPTMQMGGGHRRGASQAPWN